MTQKQKRATKILVENGGKSASKAMWKAGYSTKTAKTPSKLTKSKSFKELVDLKLPDSYLMEKHKELLDALIKTKTIVKGKTTIVEERTDSQAVKGGLDMAYRIKGLYSVVKADQPFQTGLEDMSDEDLNRALKDKQFLIDRYQKFGRAINN